MRDASRRARASRSVRSGRNTGRSAAHDLHASRASRPGDASLACDLRASRSTRTCDRHAIGSARPASRRALRRVRHLDLRARSGRLRARRALGGWSAIRVRFT